MQLFGTPRSHFARIVRVVAHELDVPFTWVDVGNVGAVERFGGNPLMEVPALVDGEQRVWGTQNACEYLVARAARDPLGVRTTDWDARNLVHVVYGVMSAEVAMILAARAGTPTDTPRFDKIRERLRTGLQYVDQHVSDAGPLAFSQVCAVSMWEHLLACDNAASGDAPRLEALSARLRDRSSLAGTRPE